MAFDLIQINEFPQVSEPGDWIVVSDATGTGYKISKEDFKEWLGTVTVITDKPITLADPAPTMDGVYLPAESGTYTNAGGLVYDPEGVDAGKYVQFIKDDAVWTKLALDLPQAENKIPEWEAGTYNQGDQRIHNGQIWSVDVPSTTEEPGTGTDWKAEIEILPKKAVGIDTFQPGDLNLLEPLYGTNRNDTSIWRTGYVDNTGLHVNSANWRHLVNPIPVSPGSYTTNIYLEGNASAVIMDSDMNVVSFIPPGGTTGGDGSRIIEVAEAGFFDFSYNIGLDNGDPTRAPLEERFVTNETEVDKVTSKVFVLSTEINEEIQQGAQDVLDRYGISETPVGKNFIQELTGSDINDPNLWRMGRLTDLGTVVPEVNHYTSMKKYYLPAGTFNATLVFRGTAKTLIMELDGTTIREVLDNQASEPAKTYNITLSSPALIWVCHRINSLSDTRTDIIYVNNTVAVYEPLSISAEEEVIPGSENAVAGGAIPVYIRNLLTSSHSPRKKKPIMTIISDDGHRDDLAWLKDELDISGTNITRAIAKFWTEDADAGTNPDRLTSAQIRDLWLNGDDIANHTVNHLRLNEMTLEEAETEILDCKLFLENIIDTPVDMFVSPFGIRSAAIDKIISKYHKANFISGYNGGRNPTPIDSFFINRVSFDSFPNGELRFDTVLKPAIDQALANNEWVIFTVHPGYDEYNPSNPVYLERRAEMGQMIAYAESLGIEVMTAKKAYEYWKNPVEIGVKRADERYYRLGMDGTEENAGVF